MHYIASFFVFFCSISSAMEAPRVQRDANGYRYRDENTAQDKRKIAILSYGSLVKQNTNNQTGAKLEASAFAPTTIQLPVSIGRQSQGNRMTAVIDKYGDLKRVWAATSDFQFLPNARTNLAAREGSPYRGQDTGYDLTNIFYLKKLLPDRMKDANEELVLNTNRWAIRTEANERQRIPTATAQALAQWADTNGYSAIIWASFPPNLSSQQAAAAKLIENAELLANTQSYVSNLPDGAQSAFEKAIIAGRDALRAFTVASASVLPAAPVPAVAPRTAAASQDHSRHLENLTHYQRGTLPIILTSPHGGTKAIPGVPKRIGKNPETGAAIAQFWTLQDDGTNEIAFAVSDNLYQLLGARPYIVAADFDRKYIDANRPGGLAAYENPNAKQYYDFYHNKIREYINEIKRQFGDKAILVDIHGQGSDGNTIYRGTRDKTTVKRLIARDGIQAFTGPQSIMGILAQKGNAVYPSNANNSAAEKGIYSGGFTVGNYGSNNANGIDALQLENGWNLRRSDREEFSQDLAEAIAGFYAEYLVS